MSNHRILISNIGIASLFIAFVSLSHAQPPATPDASRATRESDRFGRDTEKRVERELRRIPQKPTTPAVEEEKPKAGEQKFFVKKVNLAGCETFLPEDFAFLLEKYENRDETLTDLNNLAREIAAEYLKKGIIAAVFLPPQEVKDNTITMQVVESRMGELEIQKSPHFRKKMLRYYWSVKEGEILRYDRISKSLQMMNKNPDREVRASLHAGAKPGTTNVILTSKTRFPIHGQYTFDREGIMTTGRERNGFGIRNNNMLGYDDTLITGLSYGKNFIGEYIYHSIPISGNGASLLYGYSYSKSTPKKDFDVYSLKSEANNTTVSIRQDIYKKDEYLGEVSIGFDAKDKVTWYSSGTGTLNRDRIRPINLAGNFVIRGTNSVTYISPEIDQGLNVFGASKKNNPLASRAGATPTYTKFLFTAQNRTSLPFKLQQSLRFRTQLASEKLFSQEQYGIGGIDTVRGYPPSDYLADKMILVNAEMISPLFFLPKGWKLPYAEKPLVDQLTGLIFLDYGYGEHKGDPKPRRLSSVGAGLRMNFYNQVSLRLEWGIPFKLFGQPALTEGSTKGRFHISLNIEDKLPSEIERIMNEMREEKKQKELRSIINEALSMPDSPLKEKLFYCLSMGDDLYKQGKLKESKKMYAMVINIGRAVHTQAQEYMSQRVALEAELNKKNDEALALYKQGKLEEAKKIWRDVESQAQVRPLEFEF
ncbi:MAG: ShlB/FhaC/HecB family hemolysin secretion/activation protein [Candidatus Omnitrophota bacterium]|nr:ShlB/FhaC/HecB family hemolysin secretion/activation protein [Candidatus Omnitrophota bacterium]